ncbi:MAG: hypothetical protein Q9191_006177, partial [Dirinaria sp. TL-2023a]
MPHTSRRKPRGGQQKRLELTDSSGWTYITKGTSAQRHQLPPASGHTLPSPVPLGSSIVKVHHTYDRYLKAWRNSTCFTETVEILERILLTSERVKIDRCVCLGLGSFTSGPAVEASMYELVALTSILDFLSHKQYKISEIYTQDPVFNHLDEAFLRERGYTVLPTPQAFGKLTPTTFLFAPHLEWPFYIQALQTTIPPALCIGNCVREYMDPIHSNTQPGSREILSRFLESTSGVDMPDFDRSSWCTSTSIYWRKARGEHDPSSPGSEAEIDSRQAINAIAEGLQDVSFEDAGKDR